MSDNNNNNNKSLLLVKDDTVWRLVLIKTAFHEKHGAKYTNWKRNILDDTVARNSLKF